jgi:hypothetical protein
MNNQTPFKLCIKTVLLSGLMLGYRDYLRNERKYWIQNLNNM